MIDFIEDIKEHCQKSPEVRVNSAMLLRFVECYELMQENQIKDRWQTIETAPKDGTTILLDVGLPWPVYGAFNAVNESFIYADMQAEIIENGADIYFETEHERYPTAWTSLPAIAKKLQSANNKDSLTT